MGRAFRFGDDVNTDAIIPAPYLVTTDPKELGSHAMEGSDQPDFAKRVRPGDVVVAGENFGCGSSREHAPVALTGAGVACVVAKSFARIFFRNAINIGLPLLECPEAAEAIAAGDEVEADLASGIIRDLTTGRTFRAEPMPDFMRAIFDAGGLVEFAKRRLRSK
ncbi:MAG TPA: 3-isopropylmalate dehydratase small subunit [Planctomycetota bacterium]|mgnify:FL=1|nr:3-isopropylmalate dehydratase small subunit [Planctomycetota bacterium]HRR80503.1 3-isopropylmalate dehydratase small subunit [Planctomycetota bacterium]HRT94905.1 3-isopropylmalate dehydratase small subunit [Planctomycetota bacterium]